MLGSPPHASPSSGKRPPGRARTNWYCPAPIGNSWMVPKVAWLAAVGRYHLLKLDALKIMYGLGTEPLVELQVWQVAPVLASTGLPCASRLRCTRPAQSWS